MRFPRTGRFGPGRSTSVAEFRTVALQSCRHVLVGVCFVALTTLVFATVPAGAQSTDDLIAQTRDKIDATAERWFESRQEAAQLESDVAELERKVADTHARAERTAITARERALQIYKGSGTDLGPVLATNDALDSVRRAELLDRANSHSQRAIDDFEIASEQLSEQRDALEERRSEQTGVVERLQREQAALERELGNLQAQAQREAAARQREAALAAQRAEQQAAAVRAQARTAAPNPAAARAPARAAAPAPAKPKPAPARPVSVPAPPPPSGGTHPHHNDPFLVCTRARESGGNYGVVSASGRYYGAYQFSPTTWNITASRSGRVELVGVLPNQASAYDQDDLAWTLYQWQGNGPWGGRC